MAKRRPELEFTEDANRDIERCALFLCLKTGGQPNRRAAEIKQAARRIVNDPRLHPVEWVHPISSLEFRRRSVGRFVIVYVYFEPSASMPDGLVSIRAIRHGAQDDFRWRVQEPHVPGSATAYFTGAAGRQRGGRVGVMACRTPRRSV